MDGVQGGKEQNCWVVELWLPFIPELNRCVDIRARAAAGEVSGRQAMGWVSLWRGWVGAWQVCVCVEGGGSCKPRYHRPLKSPGAGGWVAAVYGQGRAWWKVFTSARRSASYPALGQPQGSSPPLVSCAHFV